MHLAASRRVTGKIVIGMGIVRNECKKKEGVNIEEQMRLFLCSLRIGTERKGRRRGGGGLMPLVVRVEGINEWIDGWMNVYAIKINETGTGTPAKDNSKR